MAKVKTVETVNYHEMTKAQLLEECYGLDRLRDEWSCTCFDVEDDDYLCFKDINGNSDDRGYAVYLKSSGKLLCLVSDAGVALEGYEDWEYGERRSELYRQIALLAGWPENMSDLELRVTWRTLIDELKELPPHFLDTTAYVWDSRAKSLAAVKGIAPWVMNYDGSVPGPEVDDNCFYIDTTSSNEE